ncbi:MAG: CHAT domain-containing protein, partial [Acidobacteriota bacterium]|nr:CHAT domain-containing protein [Acidobacteriota bacterium]
MRQPTFRLLLFVLIITQLSVFNFAQTKPEQASQRLEQGKPVERELKGGEVHTYSIQVKAAQLLRLIVEQRGIDVVIALNAPDGKQLAEMDSPSGTQGPEQIEVFAEAAGEYQLKVQSLEKEAAAGRYEVKIETLRDATAKDRNRVAALKKYYEALELEQRRDAASIRQAISIYEEAAPLLHNADDFQMEAEALNNIGLLYHETGNSEKAIPYFTRALPLNRAAGRLVGEAENLINLGSAYDNLSEPQKALDYYSQGLTVIKGKDPLTEGIALGNIGKIYTELGEHQKAIEYILRSIGIKSKAGDREGEAASTLNLAATYSGMGDKRKALEIYQKALDLTRAAKSPRMEAAILNNIGSVHHSLGETQKALEFLNQSLELRRKTGDRNGEISTLNNLGVMHKSIGERQKGRDFTNQALNLSRTTGNKSNEAMTLFSLALTEFEDNNLAEARSHIENALAILESLRTKLASRQSRIAFFATVQRYYELYRYILMKQHRQNPSVGYDAQALQSSERARARALLDTLSETGIDIRQGADPQILERERNLQQKLNERAERQSRLSSSKAAKDEIAALQKEITALTDEYQDVQTQIRRNNSRYAALIEPVPLTVSEIQRDLLDADTVLLEYALGNERSFLWVVTSTSLNSYELPKRSEIETAVRRVYELLSDGKQWTQNNNINTQYAEAAGKLSEMLLAPVAEQLKDKRLVVVSDGALQYVPFAALPRPKTKDQFLVETNEIVSLPSASTLAVLRRETANRRQAAKSVAVFADPVFADTDERLATVKANRTKSIEKPTTNLDSSRTFLERAFNWRGETNALVIPRLPFTRREAEAVLATASSGSSLKAMDFKANRETALSSDLSNYRIVHFATHGLLNSEHPELSGIVLSLVNENGQPVNGFLRLNENYNLNHSADFVVLSACQTALGKEVRGEGLVGLTRGFMYAGSPRVVASLWKVD